MELISATELLARCKKYANIPNPETKEEWLEVFRVMVYRTVPEAVVLVAGLTDDEHHLKPDELFQMMDQEMVKILFTKALKLTGMSMDDILHQTLETEKPFGNTGLTEKQAEEISKAGLN